MDSPHRLPRRCPVRPLARGLLAARIQERASYRNPAASHNRRRLRRQRLGRRNRATTAETAACYRPAQRNPRPAALGQTKRADRRRRPIQKTLPNLPPARRLLAQPAKKRAEPDPARPTGAPANPPRKPGADPHRTPLQRLLQRRQNRPEKQQNHRRAPEHRTRQRQLVRPPRKPKHLVLRRRRQRARSSDGSHPARELRPHQLAL